jgi:Reverse transcriptase (RNA-dependent DNA polymerase)
MTPSSQHHTHLPYLFLEPHNLANFDEEVNGLAQYWTKQLPRMIQRGENSARKEREQKEKKKVDFKLKKEQNKQNASLSLLSSSPPNLLLLSDQASAEASEQEEAEWESEPWSCSEEEKAQGVGFCNRVNRKRKRMPSSNNTTLSTSCVHVLTKKPIHPSLIQVLALGTHFIPTPPPDQSILHTAMSHFRRQIRLKWHFKDDPESPLPKWSIPSNWNPPSSSKSPHLEKLMDNLESDLQNATTQEQYMLNFNPIHKRRLNTLLKSKEIMVITADKNLGYVIVDVPWYIDACLAHLNNQDSYKDVTSQFLGNDQGKSSINAIVKNIESLTTKFQEDLSPDELRFICHQKEWSLIRFYITAKVHKSPIKGRPICPSMTWMTFNLSQWISAELQPFVDASENILKDTTELINILESNEIHTLIRNKPKTLWLITADVEALYPNINTESGLQQINLLLQECSYPSSRREFLINSLALVLNENYVTFREKVYQQTNGTAMGSPMAPNFANLYMYQIEKKTVQLFKHKGLAFYTRFIDDIFAIFNGTRKEAMEFIQAMNSLHPTIKITHQISLESVPFLDVTITKGHRYKAKGILDISIHQKELNKYLYLPYHSYHTIAQKLGFIKGEAIRYVRLNSSKDKYDELLQLFIERLQRRGYPLNFIQKALKDIDYNKRTEYLTPHNKEEKFIPLIFKVSHNPALDKKHIRNALDNFTQEVSQILSAPKSLKEKITICHILPPKMHDTVTAARKRKGF